MSEPGDLWLSGPSEEQPPRSGSAAEGEAEAPRRPRRRRRGPTRPPAEVASASSSQDQDIVAPPPRFRPLDSAPAPAPVMAASPESPGPRETDGVETRMPRRPLRRRSSVAAQSGPAAAEDSMEAQPEPGAAAPPAAPASLDAPQNVPADSDGVAPVVSTLDQPTRAADRGVDVNVVVPRGMGRRVNSKLIQQVAQLALQREGWDTPASLDVVIVSDEEMREINVTRRGVDEATDVLSFPMLEVRPEAGLAEDFFVLPPETQLHLGDIVISFSRVESQADEAGHSRERELAFLTVHAVLHILGYDHDTEDKRRRMRRREEDVLVELGLRRNGA